ncbi:RNI-like protein [Fomitopsis betulina]|nr:RNI-like protein [Fomitopsis betulina]
MSSGRRPAKRRRVAGGTIGQPTEDDELSAAQAQANAPTATALSTRHVLLSIPSLTSLCIRVFADNLRKLSQKPPLWDNVRSWLKALPDPLAQRVFAALKSTCPQLLSDDLITTYFIRAPIVALDRSLPGVNRRTFVGIRDCSVRTQIQELHLTGFDKEPDTVFASIISSLPDLRVLVLRGNAKVSEKTCSAVAKKCPKLTVLNLSYTSANPVHVAPILLACPDLEVLKVAGISSWTDAAFAKLTAACQYTPSGSDFSLPKLRTLKLRQTSLSDNALAPFMRLCPNLRRVDLSFTLVRHPSHLLDGKPLEKLSLTSTKVAGNELLSTINQFPGLVTLCIGALGGGQASTVSIGNTSAMTLDDQTLRELTEILEPFPLLERIDLVANTKLGLFGHGINSAVGDFVRRVGRRCKILNLSGMPLIRSSDLEGLPQESAGDGHARVEILLLNNTSVDDDAAPYISACDLENLAVSGTKLTNSGLFPIIHVSPRLQKLDLTSCRGVKISDRRRFFEVWEEEWEGS